MKLSMFGRYPFGICAALSLLAGCGSTQTPTALPEGLAPAPTRQAVQSGVLLYVVGIKEVYVFTYPGGRLVGQSKKYSGNDACSDKRGDVFVTAFGGVSVFAHGDTKPVRELSTDDDTYGCAVDPTTGNLTVLDAGSGILVFKKGRGKGKPLGAGGLMFGPQHLGYDNAGDLFVDGYAYSKFRFAELPRGSTKFEPIFVEPTIVPGRVQWDGKYITVESVGETGVADVYRLRITGNAGKIVGTTTLTQASMVPQLSWIYGDAIIVPYSSGSGYTDDAVGVWNYPAGGKAIKTITKGFGSGPVALAAAAISVSPAR